MSKPVLYLFNGKVARFGSGVLGFTPPPPEPDHVQIGDQIWSSKNLSIDDGGEGIYTQTVDYGEGDVVEYYYNYDAAVRVAAAVPGYHLPSQDEWNTLISYVGSNNGSILMRSTYGWRGGNGTDDYGFAAFPAGEVSSENHLYDFGGYASFWTTTETSSSGSVFYCALYPGYFHTSWDINKTWGISVRLIKDS